MIKIKLEKNKSEKIVFKLKIDDGYRQNVLFKRALMESKILKEKSRYDYEVPLRFFIPICNNIDKKNLKLDKKSILSYLEFSDWYDQDYYIEIDATAKYMKKWRDEGCPDIYRITIDQDNYDIKKEVAFKKHKINVEGFNL